MRKPATHVGLWGLSSLLVALLLVGLAPGQARADFGISNFDGRVTVAPAPIPIPNPGTPSDPANFPPDFTQAGGHPYEASTAFTLRTEVAPGGGSIRAEGGRLRDVSVELPPGLIGNPSAVPQCLNFRRIATVADSIGPFDPERFCPTDSIVGTAFVRTGYPGSVETKPSPIFSVEPSAGVAAAFAFDIETGTTVIEAKLRDNDGYRIEASVRGANDSLNIIGSEVVLWGNPADPIHDSFRCGSMITVGIEYIYPPICLWPEGEPGGPGPAGYAPSAFLTNPTACTADGEGLDTDLRVSAYNDAADTAQFESHLSPGFSLLTDVPVSEWGAVQGPDGCDQVPFEPETEFAPTNSRADSPSGLDVDLAVPSDDLEEVGKIAQSHLKKAVVTLPQGMSVNPASADGLVGCSPAQLARETATSQPGEGCPLGAKIGSVEIESPLLALRDASGEAQRDQLGRVIAEPITGSVYLASQRDNPFGSLLALYIVAKSPERGIVLKLPGKVVPDPESGQLVATFDDNPQLPFSSLHLEFKSGSRAPLITPSQCGTYEIESDLYPWARPAEPVHQVSSFKVTAGPNGGPCPTHGQFDPVFEAGTETPIAGAFSPLIVNANRPEGSGVIEGIDLTLPEGLLGKLADVPTCSEGALSAAEGSGGKQEVASSSCPSESKVGAVDVGVGAGGTPFHVSGQIYLAGPHKGAPLSLAVITPAVAGPFDLGTVVTRAAVSIDPVTTQIKASSDPIPTILEGIPLKVRSVSVNTNRPDFTINPTDCDPTTLNGILFGASTSKAVSDHFQVGACKALDFEPKLKLAFKGAVHRRAHPSLRATLTARPGDANIARAQVKLPKSAFLDNAHIGDICTRVDFAKNTCPTGSIYGKATATSPLLDYEVAGPVILRANPTHNLPDLVVAFKGPDRQPIAVELAGKTDSVKGALRNTFEAVPDVPVTRFSLTLFGGKKGLVEMSSGFCKSPMAEIKLDAQSGAIYDTSPKVAAKCKRKRQ